MRSGFLGRARGGRARRAPRFRPPHKAILLSRAYKDAGVGVVPGDPLGDPLTTPSVTMAVLFGQRRVRAASARRRATR